MIGRVLENISDDVLNKGDITAKIKFEAITFDFVAAR